MWLGWALSQLRLALNFVHVAHGLFSEQGVHGVTEATLVWHMANLKVPERLVAAREHLARSGCAARGALEVEPLWQTTGCAGATVSVHGLRTPCNRTPSADPRAPWLLWTMPRYRPRSERS